MEKVDINVNILMGLMLHPEILILLLFLSVLVAVELGRLYGWRRGSRLKVDTPGAGSLNNAIFALLGLFMAFSFSGAASRYDARRQLIINEVKSSGTVAARIDLAPAAAQPELHATLERYLKARIATDRPVRSPDELLTALRKANAVQGELWSQAVAVSRLPDAATSVTTMLLPSINILSESASALTYSSLMHPPPIIHYMLIILALTAGFMAGIGLSTHEKRTWIHAVNFAAIVTAVIFITIDLEYPRAGYIRTDSFEATINSLSKLG